MSSIITYDFTTVGYLLLVFFLFWYLISTFVSWKRLRHVPGPFLASISYLWVAKVGLLGRTGVDYARLAKYGHLVRVGPNYLLTDDPATYRHIAAARNKYGRDSWSEGLKFDPHQDNMISSLDIAAHDEIKAKVANGYNGRDNVDIEGGVNSQITRLKSLIRRQYLSTSNETKIVDLTDLVNYLTLDIISYIAFGQAFGFLDEGKDLYDYNATISKFHGIAALVADLPLVRWLVKSPIMKPFLPKHSDEKGAGKIFGIAREMAVSHYQEKKTGERDMISSFLRHGLNLQQCEAETAVQVFAGSDTTAGAIRSTFLYIISTPFVYNRIKNEIKSAIAEGRASTPIRVEEAKKLSYLQAIIWEGLRIRPPVVYGQYKKVPPGGDTVNGIFVPGGTAIGHNTVSMMRSKETFGHDVEIFRPERFLDCDETQRLRMERTIDLIFGSGTFMCAGKVVAFAELNKVYFELLRTFDFQVAYPGRAWNEKSYFTWVQKNLWVKITEAQ